MRLKEFFLHIILFRLNISQELPTYIQLVFWFYLLIDMSNINCHFSHFINYNPLSKSNNKIMWSVQSIAISRRTD